MSRRRRKTVRRKRIFRKGKGLAKRVNRIENTLKKAEFKQLQIDATLEADNTLTTVTNVHHLTIIPQGDANNQRIGKECILKSLHIKGVFFNDAGSHVGRIRILVFWARDVNGVLPLLSDVLDDVVTIKHLAHRNPNTKNDFVVHYDKTFEVSDYITGEHRSMTLPPFYKKLNHKITWSTADTAGTIGTARDGHWFLAATCRTSAAVAPDLQYNSQVFYQD